jgi:hypothetical protein
VAWDAFAWFLLGGGSVAVAVGLLVFALGPTRPANQILATVLVAQGALPQGILISIVEADAAAPWLEAAVAKGIVVAISSLGFLHLLFIGQAIPHASVAWLRQGAGPWVVVAAWVVTTMAVFEPALQTATVLAAFAVAIVAAAYSAVAAWLERASRAPGSAARRRATTYLASFVTRDLGLAWMTVASSIAAIVEIGAWPFVVGRCIMIVSHLAIAAALLKSQVLGLNRRIVTGSSYAGAAALLVVAFVVATEVVEAAVSGGDQFVGIAAAVVLALSLRPLQTRAQRWLVRLFPSAQAVSSLATQEKAAMYREQVELAYDDGVLGTKERRMLDRMVASLGLTHDAARGIESRVRRASAPRTRARRGGRGAAEG